MYKDSLLLPPHRGIEPLVYRVTTKNRNSLANAWLQLLTRHSKSRPDCYGVLLFQGCVTEERYHEWAQNTNWDRSRGKCGLPVNLRVFFINTVSQTFLSMTDTTRNSIEDRVNEYLRSPRKSGHGLLLLM